MGRLEVLQKFISFLEENDILLPYINNLSRPLDILLSTNRFIMGAFYWRKLLKGITFGTISRLNGWISRMIILTILTFQKHYTII